MSLVENMPMHVYCEDCDVARVRGNASFIDVSPHAIDPAEAARLWALSSDLTGVDIFKNNL